VIADSAFGGCSRMTNIVIPDSVTRIGSYAFEDCSSLTSVVIPDNVTTIGNYAFDGCSSLENITLLAKIPATIATYIFMNIPPEAKFYCLSSAINSYKTATNWNTYATQFVADDMRLSFTMNAKAQKKYFASKEQVETLSVDMKSYVQQYIRDNFATLMAEYLNSETATENKPTAADIGKVFNENEEA
jgi:hypothetical protein